MQLFTSPPARNFQPVVIPQDTPVYRIKDGKLFADDVLYEAGSIITWPDEPNVEMEPLNEMAVKAMKTYLAKLDKAGRAVAAVAGRAYVSMADAFDNSYAMAMQEGKRVTLLNGSDEPVVLGKKHKTPPRARKIDIPSDPVVFGTNGPLSVGGRQGVETPLPTEE